MLLALSLLYAGSVAASPFDVIARRYADLDRFSGTVLVAQKGKVLYRGAFGLANREFAIPNRVDTRFDLGSLSKQFTAAAILKLESEGKLKVEDKVSTILEDYPKPLGDEITIDNLLDHTSGVPSLGRRDGVRDVDWDGNPKSLHDLIAISWARPLQFKPGSQYRYDNSGYAILAAVIEKASGMPYSEYMRTHLFQPAGLANTGLISADEVQPNIAERYKGYAPDYTKPAYIHPSWTVGFAGIYSTVNDLYHWEQALMSGSVMPKAEVDKLFQKHTQRARPATYYGYGWFIDTFEGRELVWHGGTVDGTVCEFYRLPTDGITVIALCNNPPDVGIDMADEIAKRCAEELLGKPYALPPQRVSVNADELRKLQGRYDLGSGHVLEVTMLGGSLQAAASGQDSWTLSTLPDQLKVDRSQPQFAVAQTVFKSFLAGDAGAIASLTAPNRMEEYGAETVKRRHDMMATWGRLIAMSPLSLKKDGTGWICAMRGTFANVDLYMHAELNAQNQLIGDYYGRTQPSTQPLVPEGGGRFFMDGFRSDSPDILLRFTPDAQRLEVEPDGKLVGRRLPGP